MSDLRKLAAEGCPVCDEKGWIFDPDCEGACTCKVDCPECARVAALLKRVEGDAVRECVTIMGEAHLPDEGTDAYAKRVKEIERKHKLFCNGEEAIAFEHIDRTAGVIRAKFPDHFEGVPDANV